MTDHPPSDAKRSQNKSRPRTTAIQGQIATAVFEKHPQWPSVKMVLSRLKEAGFKALLAGGCVRDSLMAREPHDFDIACNATPDEIESLFPQSVGVGKAFGVIVLPFPGFQLEIATFREDLEYQDGRRPEAVRFATAEADARRRDFTVNALFYDVDSGQVIDYVGGDDLKRRLIQTVGDADRRFEEDKLRLLRGVRFAAQLDFEIESATFEAILRKAPGIRAVSRERVRDELLKILKSPNRLRGLELLLATGLLAELFPTLSSSIFNGETEWLDRFAVLRDLGLDSVEDKVLWWALFFWPVHAAGVELRDHLADLRLDRKTIESILFVLRETPRFLAPQTVRRGEMILLLSRPEASSARRLASVLESLERDRQSGAQERRVARESYLHSLMGPPLSPAGEKPAPFVSGADLKAERMQPGPRMGELLREIYLLQLEGVLRDRDEALAWLKAQVRSSTRS